MELWIRSQDKKSLKRINTEIYLRRDLSDYAKGDVFFLVSGGGKLGEYDTEERALEVLDEIQRLITPTIEYNPVIKKEESWEEEYQRTVLKGYDVKVEQAITYVYKMPKE